MKSVIGFAVTLLFLTGCSQKYVHKDRVVEKKEGIEYCFAPECVYDLDFRYNYDDFDRY